MTHKNLTVRVSQSALSAALVSMLAPQALAQGSDAGEEVLQLERTVVTAQRTEEGLQDVPIAVNAPSGDLLQSTGVLDTRSLAVLVPNLEVGNVNQSATLFLRGVGTQNTIPGVEPSVATYVDGVYFPSPAGALFFYNNIDRIEVLKGPQGTLFGRNATGGVIHVITKDPGEEPEFNLSAGYDNLETIEINGYGSIPLTDSLATDLAVYFRDQGEGYGTNGNTGEDVLFNDTFSVRNKWRLDLENTTATAILNYTENENDLGAFRVPFEDTVLFSGQTNEGFFTSFTNVPDPDARTETINGSVEVRHDFGGIELVSITAYTDLDTSFTAIADGSAAAAVQLPVEVSTKTFTQELQLIGGNEKLDWILGAYYFNDDTSADRFETILFNGTLTVSDLVASQETESIAGFGQVTYNVTDQFSLTGGFRYTNDDRDFSALQLNFVPPAGSIPNDLSTFVPTEVDDSTSDGEATWRLAASYNFTDDILAYVSYNRGFKSGQFAFNELGNDPVESEILDAFEVGVKSELLDKRVRLNIAGFYYDYRDLQAQQVVGTTPVTVNAGDAEIYGLDLDFQALLTSELSIFGGLGLIEGEYADFPNAIGFIPNEAPAGIPGPPGAVPGSGNQPIVFDATGNTITSANELTLNIGANYERTTAIGDFDVTAVLNQRGETFFNFNNTVSTGPFTVVNGSVGWTEPNGRYGLTLWAENLFDEEYILRVESFGFGDFATPARPRTYGVRANVNF